jgi:ribosomal protein L7/L12
MSRLTDISKFLAALVPLEESMMPGPIMDLVRTALGLKQPESSVQRQMAPDQMAPDQMAPDQMAPDQMAPDQIQSDTHKYLVYFGDKKIPCIKAIRSVTNLGLKEAKKMCEGVPQSLDREMAARVNLELGDHSGCLVEDSAGAAKLQLQVRVMQRSLWDSQARERVLQESLVRESQVNSRLAEQRDALEGSLVAADMSNTDLKARVAELEYAASVVITSTGPRTTKTKQG